MLVMNQMLTSQPEESVKKFVRFLQDG